MRDLELEFTFRWVNQSMQHLIDIHDLLEKMHGMAHDPKCHDFQEEKRRLSEIIDGYGGTLLPTAQLDDKPLFLGMLPSIVRKVAREFILPIHPVNLYTGYERDGFFELICKDPFSFKEDSLPFSITGRALDGSNTHLVLDHSASNQDDVYIGMTLIITSGPGAHQQTKISSFDGITQTAGFMVPLAKEIQKDSTYLIESNFHNKEIFSIDGTLSVARATHIFGADNYRSDLLDEGVYSFKSMTEEESNFRFQNHIPSSDSVAYTHAEKTARRLLNLFDQEFGNLTTTENRGRMQGCLQRAIEQIRLLIQRKKDLISKMQMHFPERVLEKLGLTLEVN